MRCMQHARAHAYVVATFFSCICDVMRVCSSVHIVHVPVPHMCQYVHEYAHAHMHMMTCEHTCEHTYEL